MINITVLVTTLNEAENLPRCLMALQEFDEIIVIDSGSKDGTVEVAQSLGAQIIPYQWNGLYPKKRQWVLDNVQTKHDYIFFVDADEEVTRELIKEIKALELTAAGYFVKGRYAMQGKVLNHGLHNNKLVLFDKNKIEFSVVDDLGINCMGEMEGHYQPVLKSAQTQEKLEQLHAPLNHLALEGDDKWLARHQRYAAWEARMIARGAYPKENNKNRDVMKAVFRKLPMRGNIAFVHSYFIKLGFLDGLEGYHFALSRRAYYKMVSRALIANKSQEKTYASNKPLSGLQK